MHDVFKTEDQRHRHRCRFPKCQDGDPGPHVADIAIGAGQSLDRGVADGRAPDQDGDAANTSANTV
jgi:hypothetical protein